MEIEHLIGDLVRISREYGLTLQNLDQSSKTLICRLVILEPVYIQFFANIENGKRNYALILRNQRIYSIDREGGAWHAHPESNPSDHVPISAPPSFEDFLLDRLAILKRLELM